MRTVKKVYAEDRFWFVPDIDGNREDPEPFKVQVSCISGQDRNRIQRIHTAPGVDPADLGTAIIQNIVQEYVHNVEGYTVELKDGSTVSPKNGEELVSAISEGPPSEESIITDLYLAIQDRSILDAGQLKNSKGPSDSSAQTVPKSNGVASDATPEKKAHTSSSESSKGRPATVTLTATRGSPSAGITS